MKLQNCKIENETYRLDSNEVNFLGPNLIAKNCVFKLKKLTIKTLIVVKSKFENCRFEIDGKLLKVNWCNAQLINSSFTGHIQDCDFGFWPDDFSDNGKIINVDFSNSILNDCRFLNTSLDDVFLPKWPCFTIVNPMHVREKLYSYNLDHRLNELIEDYEYFPSDVTLVTHECSVIEKEYGFNKELKEILSNLDFVH